MWTRLGLASQPSIVLNNVPTSLAGVATAYVSLLGNLTVPFRAAPPGHPHPRVGALQWECGKWACLLQAAGPSFCPELGFGDISALETRLGFPGRVVPLPAPGVLVTAGGNRPLWFSFGKYTFLPQREISMETEPRGNFLERHSSSSRVWQKPQEGRGEGCTVILEM